MESVEYSQSSFNNCQMTSTNFSMACVIIHICNMYNIHTHTYIYIIYIYYTFCNIYIYIYIYICVCLYIYIYMKVKPWNNIYTCCDRKNEQKSHILSSFFVLLTLNECVNECGNVLYMLCMLNICLYMLYICMYT